MSLAAHVWAAKDSQACWGASWDKLLRANGKVSTMGFDCFIRHEAREWSSSDKTRLQQKIIILQPRHGDRSTRLTTTFAYLSICSLFACPSSSTPIQPEARLHIAPRQPVLIVCPQLVHTFQSFFDTQTALVPTGENKINTHNVDGTKSNAWSCKTRLP
jgi:hypothetical protein